MASRRFIGLFLFLAPAMLFAGGAPGETPVCPALLPDPVRFDPAPIGDPESDTYFADEVWAKVGERTCLNCHSAGGDAEESKFLLRDASLQPELLHQNRQAFERMAALKKDGRSKLLIKVSGGLDHGGGVQLKADSTGYRILERFVRRIEGKADAAGKGATYVPPLLQGVRMTTTRASSGD